MIRFQTMPLTKASRYEPVRSKIAPEIHPPRAMPTIVAMKTLPIRIPASRGAKYSRTIMA